MTRSARWTVLALSLAGCASSDELTEVVVVVDSDIQGIDSLALAADNFDDVRVASANLGPGEELLPRSIGIVHEGGPFGPLGVTVFALDEDENVILVRRAKVFFVPRQVRMLRLDLTADCLTLYERCLDDQTCVEGRCTTDEGTLEPWTGVVPESRF